MIQSFRIFLTILCLAAISLVVVTPVLCELDTCCSDDCEEQCTPDCIAMCCAVAVCVESFDGLELLDAVPLAPLSSTSTLPQGVLPLPDRPPIASC